MAITYKVRWKANFADVIKYLKENRITNIQIDLSKMNPKKMQYIIKLVTKEKEFFIKNKIQLDNCLIKCNTIAEIDPIISCFHSCILLIGAEENECVQPIDINTYFLLREKLENIVGDISPDLSRIEKFKKVYTRLGKEISYDYDDPEFLSSRNLISTLLKGKGLCAGFAEAVKQACSLVGVPCKYVISKEDENGDTHAYNVVEYEPQKWANADLTNDYIAICNGEKIQYALKSDEDFREKEEGELKIHHTPEDNQKIPECPKSIDLYSEVKVLEDLQGEKKEEKSILKHLLESIRLKSNSNEKYLITEECVGEDTLKKKRNNFLNYLSNRNNFSLIYDINSNEHSVKSEEKFR